MYYLQKNVVCSFRVFHRLFLYRKWHLKFISSKNKYWLPMSLVAHSTLICLCAEAEILNYKYYVIYVCDLFFQLLKTDLKLKKESFIGQSFLVVLLLDQCATKDISDKKANMFYKKGRRWMILLFVTPK